MHRSYLDVREVCNRDVDCRRERRFGDNRTIHGVGRARANLIVDDDTIRAPVVTFHVQFAAGGEFSRVVRVTDQVVSLKTVGPVWACTRWRRTDDRNPILGHGASVEVVFRKDRKISGFLDVNLIATVGDEVVSDNAWPRVP